EQSQASHTPVSICRAGAISTVAGARHVFAHAGTPRCMGIAAKRTDVAAPLGQVGLDRLMALTSGRPEIVVGLIDGPIAIDHPAFDGGRIRLITAGAAPPAASPTAAS